MFKYVRAKDYIFANSLSRWVSSQPKEEPKVLDNIKELAKDKKELITSANLTEGGAELGKAEATTLKVPRLWDMILRRVHKGHFGLAATKLMLN